EIEAPFPEARLGLLFFLRPEHHEHALLALREHHLVGAHAGLAARYRVEIERDAEIAFGAHLHRRAGEARRAHVLDGDDAVLGHDFEAGLEQQVPRERIADLHGGALFVGTLAEFGRRHGGAMDAVAAGLGAEIDDRHADARSGGIENLVAARDTHRHRIDEAVAVVAGVKTNAAAHRRYTEGIAVAADAGDHAGGQMSGLRVVRRARGAGIGTGNRPPGPG